MFPSHLNTNSQDSEQICLFPMTRLTRILLLALLVVIAFGIRLFGLNHLPLVSHPTRQYRSALIARSYYYSWAEDIPAWQVELARETGDSLGYLEPPFMEILAATSYLLVGAELLWIPRLWAAFFWVCGGIMLFRLASYLSLKDGAFFATIFYLFLPFGVVTSRNFQPESLLVLLTLSSVLTLLVYYETLSTKRLIITIAVSAAAILVKPVAFFPIMGTVIAQQIYHHGLWRGLLHRRLVIIGLLVLLPGAAYYGFGIYTLDSLNQQAQATFVPEIMLQFRFWDGWLKRVRLVMGFTYLFAGLVGLLLFHQRERVFLLGLWLGYLAMCLAFPFHISTHDYYHLPLIPIVGIGLGPVAETIINSIMKNCRHRVERYAFLALMTIAFLLTVGTFVQQVRTKTQSGIRIETIEALGEMLDHNDRLIVLEPFYGYPSYFHGNLVGVAWPYRYDIRDETLVGAPEFTVRQRFNQIQASGPYDYFVVFDLAEFEAQAELEQFLLEEFPTTYRDDEILVFDLR